VIGRSFGNYEIVDRLGKGGMGDVYRARDTRLGREVAVKMLPPEFVADADRLARFEREAKLLASLKHPGIATIHGLEDTADGRWLVLELIDGEDIARRLKRAGPISLEEALPLAVQIAEALEAAHESGVVHRDLKPSNVMVEGEGRVKLLDFGLAKADERGAASASHDSPTLTAQMTQAGVILGTAPYMSPEQARGKAVDKRADIWAYGCVLYEMLTGSAAFRGENIPDILSAVIRLEPDLDRLPADTPLEVRRVIERCFKKNPRDRLRDIGDARTELQEAIHAPAVPDEDTRSAATRRTTFVGLAAIVGAAAMAALALGIFVGSRFSGPTPAASPRQPVVRAKLPLPDGHRLAGWAAPTVDISDDGSAVAFVTVPPGDGPNQLWVRRLDETESFRVPDSDTAEGPVFSPDGKWILFAVGVSGGTAKVPSELRKYSIESGITQTLCPVRDYFGGDWTADGTIYWAGQVPQGLWRISENGGQPENFLRTMKDDGAESEFGVVWPSLLPDGRRALANTELGTVVSRTGLIDLTSGRWTDLGVESTGILPLGDGSRVAWVDLKGNLMVAPFDLKTGRLTAAGRAVDRDLSISGPSRSVFAVSKNGTAVLTRGPVRGSGREPRRIVRVARDGSRTLLPLGEEAFTSLSVAPDGRRLVLTTWDDLSVYDVESGGRIELVLGDDFGAPEEVSWSPDGRWIAFSASRANEATFGVYLIAAHGSTAPRLLFEPRSEAQPMSWEPDGQAVLVGDFVESGPERIVARRVPLDGSAPETISLGAWRGNARLSPDGEWIAFRVAQGNDTNLFVRRYPEMGPILLVAKGRYGDALWSEDGSKLYGFDSSGVYEFDITRGAVLQVGAHRRLFENTEGLGQPQRDPTSGSFYAMEDIPGAGHVTELEILTQWMQNLPGGE